MGAFVYSSLVPVSVYLGSVSSASGRPASGDSLIVNEHKILWPLLVDDASRTGMPRSDIAVFQVLTTAESELTLTLDTYT